MYLRTVKAKGGKGEIYEYIRLVEAYWEDGRSKQRVVSNLGRKDLLAPHLDTLVRLLQGEDAPQSEKSQVQFQEAAPWGPALVARALWRQLGLEDNFERLERRDHRLRGEGLSLSDRALVLVTHRLCCPGSEHALASFLETAYVCDRSGRRLHPKWKQHGRVQVDLSWLQRWYRTLDELLELKQPIETALFGRLRDLFALESELVFYDLTSTYFEGEGPALAKKGHSRDHRPDRPQVEIGLLVNRDGIPLSHMVFEGNVKDSTTLPQVVDQMRGAFKVKRCIFVGDKGMVTSKNLKELSSAGYEYIVSIKLRRSKEAERLLGLVPERDRFTELKDNLLIYELPSSGEERYIACYNPIRAQETREHREDLLKRCEEFLAQFLLPSKQGKTKDPLKVRLRIDRFLRRKSAASFFQYGFDSVGKLTYHRREEEISKEAALDGLFIIKTNSKVLSPEALALGYKTLWEVENAFREVKDFIKIRPIYHHNGERVRGHIFICFLAYLLEKLLEKKLEDHGLFMSARKALQDLSSIKVVISELAGQEIKKVTSVVKEQEQILKALGAQRMPRIVP